MVRKISVIFSIAQNNMKKWLVNPRIYLIIVLLIAYFHSKISPIYSFCAQHNTKITPYLFPYFMSDDHVVLIATLGAMLLFCDAPFIDSEQPYIILRSGRKKWALGQFAYIAVSSAIFTLFLYLLTLLLLLPQLTLSTEWGKVIGTLVQTNTGTGSGITISFDRYIFFGYSPVIATLTSLFLCFSVVFFLGMLMFYLNLRITRAVGTIAGALLILWQLVIRKTDTILIRYSPVSWMKLGQIDIDGATVYPNLAYVLVALYGMIVLFAVLSVFQIRKTDIDVLKSV
ncbi:MAG: hypothetical protein RSC76_06000 [Oscillospiraceae bacterium]